MEKRTQRSYTPEQKMEAVSLAREVGAKEAAKQLGYPEDTLYTWIAKSKKGTLKTTATVSDASSNQDEVERLREEIKELKAAEKSQKAEIAQLRRERQILEDATSFFASRQR